MLPAYQDADVEGIDFPCALPNRPACMAPRNDFVNAVVLDLMKESWATVSLSGQVFRGP